MKVTRTSIGLDAKVYSILCNSEDNFNPEIINDIKTQVNIEKRKIGLKFVLCRKLNDTLIELINYFAEESYNKNKSNKYFCILDSPVVYEQLRERKYYKILSCSLEEFKKC
jgi:hypothetical protein